jgi:ATPase subunit of ABC transporter with duplicated ATPase domains
MADLQVFHVSRSFGDLKLLQDIMLEIRAGEKVGLVGVSGSGKTTLRNLQQDTGSFSLGEQMKIKLAVPILARQDFLILDEPTNYLDLHARECLEEALSNYPGTLLLVSHDQYLLRQVCDKVLVIADRRIRRLEQSFAEYLESGG